MGLFLVPSIGSRVIKARIKLDISQKELGERVGTTQQAIQKIEAGGVSHSRYLEPIATALGVSYNWIVKGVADPVGNVNSDEFILTATDALHDALNSFKAISFQEGVDLSAIDFNLLKMAFDVSLRGRLTGDYVTAALRMNGLKKA
jgi:transcriptional regulator with XRE-family HTH domain